MLVKTSRKMPYCMEYNTDHLLSHAYTPCSDGSRHSRAVPYAGCTVSRVLDKIIVSSKYCNCEAQKSLHNVSAYVCPPSGITAGENLGFWLVFF